MTEITLSEAMIYWRYISSSLDRLVGCLAGLDEEALNWKPLPTGNSLYVLATHTLGNTEENVLGVLCGELIVRHRDAEFASYGASLIEVEQVWRTLRERVERHLETIPPTRLDGMCDHPRRGAIMGREVLLIVARHCTEHLGQAELTRALLLAN